jgi:MarR family transcriptional regulator, 2-MHQ and catechol-resistance regulon repressor
MTRPPQAAEEEGADSEKGATLQLLIALARAYQALEQGVRPHLAQHGLGMTEFAVLEVLYHKGVLPVGEIRDRILVTGASTTYVLKKLEERRLVLRRTSVEDQRVVLAQLTSRGRALIDEVFPAHVNQLCDLMAGLSITEKQAATRLMRRLGQHARRVTGERLTDDDEAEATPVSEARS